MTLMHTARLVGRRFGLEIQRAGPATLPMVRLVEMLHQRGLSAVLDVGANDGGYAADLLAAGYSGSICSFEPLPDAYEALLIRSAKHGSRWGVAPRVALSNADEITTFYEAGNSVSSSLLAMTGAHADAAPQSATVRSLKVQTNRLDGVLPKLGLTGNLFLKLDVQGAERLVLDGAQTSLAGPVKGVQLEMSLAELYAGQDTARELDAYLRNLGFELWDMLPGFRDPRTHRLLQYDGIYFRVEREISCLADQDQ